MKSVDMNATVIQIAQRIIVVVNRVVRLNARSRGFQIQVREILKTDSKDYFTSTHALSVKFRWLTLTGTR